MRARTCGLVPAVLFVWVAAGSAAQAGQPVTLMAPVPAAPAARLGTPRTSDGPRADAVRSAVGHARSPIRTVRAQDGPGGFRPPPPPADGWGDTEDGYFDEPPGPAATIGPLDDARPVSVYTTMPPPESSEELYNSGAVRAGLPPVDTWVERGGPRSESLSPFDGMFSAEDPDPFSSRQRFESDHAFDNYISPVTNPFLAEDPRTLTEIRPIFMYQTIPDDQYLYLGGDIEFFGGQGRLALTERFSFVIHKLGGVRIGPGEGSLLDDEIGFSELHLGPKYNFWRDEVSKLLVTGGLIFQVPIGSSETYQDTGDLSLVPYVSVAKPIWQTSWGTFNLMDTFGIAFATDDERSNFFSNSLHLDFDIHDRHCFYPLIELNWLHYTDNGNARPLLGFEMGDLGNTGAAVDGRDYFTIATGARYKITDQWIFGIAAEFPLVGTRDLNDFRLTADLIWRY